MSSNSPTSDHPAPAANEARAAANAAALAKASPVSASLETQLESFQGEAIPQLEKAFTSANTAATIITKTLLDFTESARLSADAASALRDARYGDTPSRSGDEARTSSGEMGKGKEGPPAVFRSISINFGGEIIDFNYGNLMEIRKQSDIVIPFLSSDYSQENEAQRDTSANIFIDASSHTLPHIIKDLISKLSASDPQTKKIKLSPPSPRNVHPLMTRSDRNRPSKYEQLYLDAISHPGDPRCTSKEYTPSPKLFTPFSVQQRSSIISAPAARIVEVLVPHAVPYLAFSFEGGSMTQEQVDILERNVYHERNSLIVMKTSKYLVSAFCANRWPDRNEAKPNQASNGANDVPNDGENSAVSKNIAKSTSARHQHDESEDDSQSGASKSTSPTKEETHNQPERTEPNDVFITFSNVHAHQPTLLFQPHARCQLIGSPIDATVEDRTIRYLFNFGGDMVVYHIRNENLLRLHLNGTIASEKSLLRCTNDPTVEAGKELLNSLGSPSEQVITSMEVFILDGEPIPVGEGGPQAFHKTGSNDELLRIARNHHDEVKDFISFPAKPKIGAPRPQAKMKNFIDEIVIPFMNSEPDRSNLSMSKLFNHLPKDCPDAEVFHQFSRMFSAKSELLRHFNECVKTSRNIVDRYSESIHYNLRQVAWLDTCSKSPTATGQTAHTSLVGILYGHVTNRRQIVTRADTLLQHPGSTLYNLIKFKGQNLHPDHTQFRRKPKHLLPFNECAPEQLMNTFREWLSDDRTQVSGDFLADIGKVEKEVFTPQTIKDPNPRTAIFKMLEKVTDNPWRRYCDEIDHILRFHKHLACTQGYTQIDLTSEALSPEAVEIVIEHMRLIKLARFGVVSDPGPLEPDSFGDLSQNMRRCLEVLNINVDYY